MARLHLFSLGLAATALIFTGCGAGDPGGPDDPNDPVADAGPDDSDGNPVTPDPDGFIPFLTRDWTASPGTADAYVCARLTVEEDTYIQAFRPLSPLGTHHTVLSVNDSPEGADGPYNCSAGSIGHAMLFASGVGTDDLGFPDGVAIPVRAGQQIDLNIHLFNVSDTELSGTSGTMVKTIPAAEVQQEAENIFAGTYNINLQDAPGQEQQRSGSCRFDQAATVVALWPHMHQLGVRARVEHTSGGNSTLLHDEPFSFEEQLNHIIEPVQVNAGDDIDVTCTWINDTGRTVRFGDGSDDEMCFVGLYRFPATGDGLFDCVTFF